MTQRVFTSGISSPSARPPSPEDNSGDRDSSGGILAALTHPHDLDKLTKEQLASLGQEIRDFLINAVSLTGGHLGPNLGVVELTIVLHRVFDSPRDRILFDTGHQAYVHKLLTGRRDFSRLRAKGGLSGYPSQAESEHDVIENSHASTALGYADGLAKANKLRGRADRAVVAVIGDGALTGGMAWEALNNIAEANNPVIVVLNDNGRSYCPTVGGLAKHLASLRDADYHERPVLQRKKGRSVPSAGPSLSLGNANETPHEGRIARDIFQNLSLDYLGPVDGHDLAALESVLRRAREINGPVVVHCLTQKGRGYRPAEENEEDCFHAVNAIHPDSGLPVKPSQKGWTSVFSEEMVALGQEREDIVAITAAMLHPVGLASFAERFPERTFDVGIAEQHAVVSAAGLATGGLHPVVAVYATFLNRAFDQVLMDVALHRLGVTMVLDRAGITGTDGASHNGVWDMSILQAVPGLRLAAPRDAEQLRSQLREAVAVEDAPTVVRYPKGAVTLAIPALGRIGGMDVLRGDITPPHQGSKADVVRADVLLVSIGAMAGSCLEAADLLAVQGVTSTVVDPRWVRPVDATLPALAAEHRAVVTVEDNGHSGGAGATIAQALRDAAVDVPLRDMGVPQRFLAHGTREEILAEIGLTGPGIARQVTALISDAPARG